MKHFCKYNAQQLPLETCIMPQVNLMFNRHKLSFIWELCNTKLCIEIIHQGLYPPYMM